MRRVLCRCTASISFNGFLGFQGPVDSYGSITRCCSYIYHALDYRVGYGVTANIAASHAAARGSIPRIRNLLFIRAPRPVFILPVPEGQFAVPILRVGQTSECCVVPLSLF